MTPYAGTMQGIYPTNTWLFSAAGSKPRPFIYIILPPFTDPVREEVYVFIKVEAYWIDSDYENTAETKRKPMRIRNNMIKYYTNNLWFIEYKLIRKPISLKHYDLYKNLVFEIY